MQSNLLSQIFLKNIMNNKLTFLIFLLCKQLLFSPMFISFFIIAGVLILGSLGLEFVTVGADLKVFKNVGLSVMNIFSMLLTILAGTSLIGNIGKKGNLDQLLLSKPFSKRDLLLASIVAVIIQITLFCLLIGFLIFIVTFVFNQLWFSGILAAVFFNMLEMTLILSFVGLFSLTLTNRLAIPLAFAIYVIGHLVERIIHLTGDYGSEATKYGLVVIQSLLPNLEFFNWRNEIIYQLHIPVEIYIQATFYAISYSFLILLISMRLYVRREY